MAVTYFGNTTPGGDAQPVAIQILSNDNVNIVYTCPGTGNQTVVALDAYVYSGSLGNMRIAIYKADKTMVCQGSAEIDTAPPGVNSWLGHVSFVDAGGSPITPTLVGGTAYILAICGDKASDVYAWCNAVTSGYIKRDNGDYTAGMPDPLVAGLNHDKEFNIRCGVEPSSTGGSIVPLLMQYYRRRR